jgi:hypothetical protein
MSHPTVVHQTGGTSVEIDVEILPVVEWLNSLKTVSTTDSCQGDEELGKDYNLPYVSFFSDSDDLIRILKVVREFICLHRLSNENIAKVPAEGIELSVSLHEPNCDVLWYTLWFMNTKSKDMFLNYLGDL